MYYLSVGIKRKSLTEPWLKPGIASLLPLTSYMDPRSLLYGHNGLVLSQAEENRLNKVNRRFLTAVKSLAQVRKLLRPGAVVQVNIVQQ